MDPLDVDVKTVLAGEADPIGPDLAGTLAEHPLDCIDTTYPHYVHSIDGPDSVPDPADRHPVFSGCFDWHSAVHSHWCLVRSVRLVDDHPREEAIERAFDERITDENVRREVEHLDESFEKPYGWAWFLRLAAELHLFEDDRADRWRATLDPLEARIRDLVATEFLPQERPFRVGTHGNTAFALAGVLDYARVVGDDDLAAAAEDAARRHFRDDEDYPIEYEPLGWDFLSPALTEADLLRRVLDREAFAAWIDGFLPDATTAPYDAVLDPVEVDGDAGGAELHLVGLNLSRAWCLAGIADALGDHPLVDPLERSAAAHAERGIEEAFTDDYAGAHWLSSFVLYLCSRNAGGIAPD